MLNIDGGLKKKDTQIIWGQDSDSDEDGTQPHHHTIVCTTHKTLSRR